MNDANSLSHSKWRCKYHIVFAPKGGFFDRLKSPVQPAILIYFPKIIPPDIKINRFKIRGCLVE